MPQLGRLVRMAVLAGLPGRWRDSLLAAHPRLRRSAPPGLRHTYDGYLDEFAISVDTRFLIDRLIWSGCYEPRLVALIGERVAAGDVCLDLGANVGPLTLPMARRVGEGGRVVAVEASPATFERLRANLDLNPTVAPRVTALCRGVGEVPGVLYWSEDPRDPGNGTLGSSGAVRVEVDTVDRIVAELGLARVDFIKLDVEGMELAVLRGARECLARHRPTLVFETLERFRHADDDRFAAIEQLLSDLGYTLYWFAADGSLAPKPPGRFQRDTVAIHPDRQ